MSIELLNEREFDAMRRAGAVAARTLATVAERLRPGLKTSTIDAWVRQDTRNRGGRPSQLGYQGFPAVVCTSRNSVACHGIPSEKEILEDGDILNVDVTTELGGFHGDTSDTFFIGEPSAEARHVADSARRARDAGIEVIRPGARLGDIGAAVEEVAHAAGLSVVRDYGGHGIGRLMHSEPHVPHTGRRARGLRLRAGMAITVEPMLNLGGPEVTVGPDGWTVYTLDGRWSAQAEHTVLITTQGHEITTLVPGRAR